MQIDRYRYEAAQAHRIAQTRPDYVPMRMHEVAQGDRCRLIASPGHPVPFDLVDGALVLACTDQGSRVVLRLAPARALVETVFFGASLGDDYPTFERSYPADYPVLVR